MARKKILKAKAKAKASSRVSSNSQVNLKVNVNSNNRRARPINIQGKQQSQVIPVLVQQQGYRDNQYLEGLTRKIRELEDKLETQKVRTQPNVATKIVGEGMIDTGKGLYKLQKLEPEDDDEDKPIKRRVV